MYTEREAVVDNQAQRLPQVLEVHPLLSQFERDQVVPILMGLLAGQKSDSCHLLQPRIPTILKVGRSVEFCVKGSPKHAVYVINGLGKVWLNARGNVVIEPPDNSPISSLFPIGGTYLDIYGRQSSGVSMSQIGSLSRDAARHKFEVTNRVNRIISAHPARLLTSHSVAYGYFDAEHDHGWYCYRFFRGEDPFSIVEDKGGARFQDLSKSLFQLGKTLWYLLKLGIGHSQLHMGNWRVVETEFGKQVAIKDFHSKILFKEDLQGSDAQKRKTWFNQAVLSLNVILQILSTTSHITRKKELMTAVCSGLVDPFMVDLPRVDQVKELVRLVQATEALSVQSLAEEVCTIAMV